MIIAAMLSGLGTACHGADVPGEPTPASLDFLAPIPEFWDFRLQQDEATIRAIAIRHGLKIQSGPDGAFLVERADGETLAISMRDGRCAGIQRLGPSRARAPVR